MSEPLAANYLLHVIHKVEAADSYTSDMNEDLKERRSKDEEI